MVLLGDSGVGKSSLVLRFINNEFRPYFETTLGAAFTHKQVSHLNTTYKYLIWDTAGQERYKALTPLYYKDAQVAIIVYDVTAPASFNTVLYWVKELQQHAQESIQLVFVGNKTDLQNPQEDLEGQAREEAQKQDALFVQTSAKSGEGVAALFDQIAEKMYRSDLDYRERALSREK